MSVPNVTPSSPIEAGSKPASWKSVGVFTAEKTCGNCSQTFRPWIKRDEAGHIVNAMKPSAWARQRFCSISCSKQMENAMADPSARAKMRATLKRIGHQPKIRGGNGRGVTRAQALVLQILGPEWVAELPVKTRRPRHSGFPSCYKLDVAHPQQMIGIELEGSTHTGTRRQEDSKKDALLHSLGWSVYRVSNARAESLCSTCTSADTLLTSLMAT